MSNLENQDLEQGYSVQDFIKAEEELKLLKEEHHIEEKTVWWKEGIDKLVHRNDEKEPVLINKKKYCLIALFFGWAGVHRFLLGRKLSGVLYLAFCWTGMSFVLSVLDIFQVLFIKPDENNCIRVL